MTRTPPPSPKTPVRAAIYARISRDKNGEGLGVDRQEIDCRALADRLGWAVGGTYVDNDISAFSGKHRPQYQQMLRDVRDGRVSGIIAWHPDRLHRRMVELEEFIGLLDAKAVEVRTVTAGDLDLSSPTGRMNARIIGAVAQKEAEQTKDRVRSAKAQAAQDGRYRGGIRPYGYRKDGTTIVEREAAVIREASTAILGGRSLSAVAAELRARGERTSTGNTWTYTLLRDVLIRPRNAGLVGKGRGAGVEIVGKAQWPAIVEEDTWRAVHSLLTDPSRRTQTGTGLRWLGAGLYRCGRAGCGAVMRAATYGDKHHYKCSESAHLTVLCNKTDEYIRAQVADLVRDPRVVAAMTPADTDGGELAADRERRAVLATRLAGFEEDYALGNVTGAQLAKATARVTAELAEIDARLAAGMQRSAASPILSAVDPGAEFLRSPIDVQRAVLAACLTVEVLPSTQRGAAWSSQRLRLTPVT